MGQESSRGLKRLAQGVQNMPKGFQKVATSHEKDIQKAFTRHPNAISKCIGNSIGNSISNAIANAMANAVTDHGTVAGRPKATGYLHFDALWKPFGCLFHDFLIPFGTFWPLLDALGEPF